jgi:hypothetical protein
MLLLQTPQGFQCLADPIQAPLVGSDQIQDVAVWGHCSVQHFGRGERFAVLPALAKRTDPTHLEFKR